MNKFIIAGLIVLIGCKSKDQYDVSNYYNSDDQKRVLTGIVTYIFEAPPQTLMQDRFQPKHQNYYSFHSNKFAIVKYFISNDSVHYFYVMRPGPKIAERRAVGGHFRMTKDFKITDFREVFVTQLMSEEEVKGKSVFLFDDLVKGDIKKDLVMSSYIQWPNPAAYYDSIKYEWALRPEVK